MFDFRLPNITESTPDGQINQIKRWLIQLVEQLNMAFNSISSGESMSSYAKSSDAPSPKETNNTFSQIKSIGKYAERANASEIADDLDLVMHGEAVADFVVEQGTSGIWTYRKWNSGRCEICGFHVADVAVNVDLGSVYRSAVITTDLPFAVYDITVVVDCCDINAWASSNTYWTSEGRATVSYLILRGAALDTFQTQTHIHVTGRWK